MKILAFSDLHGIEPDSITLPAEWEVMVIAGDLAPGNVHCNRERNEIRVMHEVANQRFWLLKRLVPWIKSHGKPCVMVPGNHDWFLDEKWKYFTETDRKALESNLIHLIIDQSVEIGGVKFHGYPWTPFFHDWAFNHPAHHPAGEEHAESKLERIPHDTDILVSHGPPLGMMDQTERGEKAGCNQLLRALYKLTRLQHLICGHIHEARGQEKFGTLTVSNVSLLNEKYDHAHQPVILEVSAPVVKSSTR